MFQVIILHLKQKMVYFARLKLSEVWHNCWILKNRLQNLKNS